MNIKDKLVDLYYSVKFAIWDLTDSIKAKFSKEEDYSSFEVEQEEVVEEVKEKKPRKKRKNKKKK